jgi:hypothetical protein
MRGNRLSADFNDAYYSSFLSCEKDTETIFKKLLVDSRPYSDELKRLLLINTKDCLIDRTNPEYLKKIRGTSIAQLREKEYIRISPKIHLGENEEVKSYILISYDNFSPTKDNGYYRDCVIEIDIICNTDYWELEGFGVRPLKIAGYIDGILNGAKLSGIGELEFLGCNEIVLSNDLSGYCLMYKAVHGNDDTIEG